MSMVLPALLLLIIIIILPRNNTHWTASLSYTRVTNNNSDHITTPFELDDMQRTLWKFLSTHHSSPLHQPPRCGHNTIQGRALTGNNHRPRYQHIFGQHCVMWRTKKCFEYRCVWEEIIILYLSNKKDDGQNLSAGERKGVQEGYVKIPASAKDELGLVVRS